MSSSPLGCDFVISLKATFARDRICSDLFGTGVWDQIRCGMDPLETGTVRFVMGSPL